MRIALIIYLLLLTAGCKEQSTTDADNLPVKKVRVLTLAHKSKTDTRLFSGSIKARTEIPVAFQVGGRIKQRLVDSGQRVAQGDTLFRLDTQELKQKLRGATAKLTAAQAELKLARNDLKRNQRLFKNRSISRQLFERSQLTEQARHAALKAAQAELELARTTLKHGTLKASIPGVLIEVSAMPGQVVSPGQPLARLADMRQLEVELQLPEGLKASPQAVAHDPAGHRFALKLREVAGAANAISHTWQVRYSIEIQDTQPELGTIVQVTMQSETDTSEQSQPYEIPLAAVDERGSGTQVWRIVDGLAQPVAAKLVKVNLIKPDIVFIEAPDLAAGDQIISLGVHRLTPGIPVKAAQQ